MALALSRFRFSRSATSLVSAHGLSALFGPHTCHKRPFSANSRRSLSADLLRRYVEIHTELAKAGRNPADGPPALPEPEDSPKPMCPHCQRQFQTGKELCQHLSGSHGPSHRQCPYCEDVFADAVAWSKHVTNEHAGEAVPADKRAEIHGCPFCAALCGSALGLAEHMAHTHARRKPVQAHACPHCSHSYTPIQALQRHVRDEHTTASPTGTATPLDAFFGQYALSHAFPYDCQHAPRTSFTRLCLHMGWARTHPPTADDDGSGAGAWYAAADQFSEALRAELEYWYGGETADAQLRGWHLACRAVGLDAPVPPDRAACRAALRGLLVCPLDLVYWARGGIANGAHVRVFRDYDALQLYMRNSKKRACVAPRPGDAEGEGVIGFLLLNMATATRDVQNPEAERPFRRVVISP